ncbi:RDD family protein [Actinomadura sp. HBU206391]|uniref:RDD family protein n=1 Tax=Actinomadura sp. HBU206391 TaxID=2731692 RepID=UPI0021C749F3|nr:RDD family protein [Actinomadura sp. HBU206391]
MYGQPPSHGEPQRQHHYGHEASYDSYGSYPAEPSPAGDLPLAPIHRRAGARVMDNALVAVFGFALILPIAIGALGLDSAGSKAKDEGGVWTWPIIFVLFTVLSVLPFLYEAVQLAVWGQTLGKRWFGLRVVKVDPAGDPLDVFTAVWRPAINHVGYQLGFFFFLILTVKVFDFAAYGLLLVSLGTLVAYLWAIWDRPLHQSVHDRFAGTVVIDDRVEWE